MTSSILIAGGTGTLGRLVVPRLVDGGAKVRVLSRTAHSPGGGVEYATGDLLKDEGIGPAVEGAEIVVHLAGARKGDDVATRNLVRAASRAGVRHLVFISVIAADRVPLGYFRMKHQVEKVVAGSGLPWTALRAAQFHDLALTAVGGMARLPIVPVPTGMRLQPVDVRDVAQRMVELALGEPAGPVRDLAGPRVYALAELVRDYLRATGKRRPTLPIRLPGEVGRVYRAGGNLNLDTADVGRRTWEAFLAERLAQGR